MNHGIKMRPKPVDTGRHFECFNTRLVDIGRGLYAGVAEVTPEMATRALESSGDLWRRLKEMKVLDFGTQMSQGKWRLDGSAIRFDSKEQLIDGQHRLNGCVLAECSFESVVIVGAIKQHPMLDTGLARTLRDWLRKEGYVRATEVAAVLRLQYTWIQDERSMNVSPTRAHSNEDLLEVLKAHPTIDDSVVFANKIGSRTGMRALIPRSWVAHLHYVMATESGTTEIANEFWDEVSTDSVLDNPAVILRAKLSRMYRETAKTGTMKVHRTYYAIVIKAWNAWITGAPLKVLRYRAFGKDREAFPRFVNHKAVD